ncbi:hypothetical protein [Azospirillum largimobile]
MNTPVDRVDRAARFCGPTGQRLENRKRSAAGLGRHSAPRGNHRYISILNVHCNIEPTESPGP